MTQGELNECVAERTGESILVIESRGFSLDLEEMACALEE